MTASPYITFAGNCAEAVELYKKAFNLEAEMMKFSDLPPDPSFTPPPEAMNMVLQATLKFGAGYIRMSDCSPEHPLNNADTEKISIAYESTVEDVQRAFAVLEKEGRVGMALAPTFYSPCAGVVFDKFGVMWNFSALFPA